MDLAQIDPLILFLAAAVKAIKSLGATSFLIVAGYCTLMEVVALLCVMLVAVLPVARRCTVHAVVGLRRVTDELRAWPRDLRDAWRRPPPASVVPTDQRPQPDLPRTT